MLLRLRGWGAANPPPYTQILTVLDTDTDQHLSIWITEEIATSAWGIVEDTYRNLEARLLDEQLPDCVAPDCTERGRLVFTAAETGRLAGRDWQYGDDIRLCPAHGHDVYRAQYTYGIDQLADWLKADARLNPLDGYDADTDSLYGDEIRRARSRMLRVTERKDPRQ